MKNSVAVDVFLEDAFVLMVYVQHLWHRNADGKQPLIVVQLRLQLVTKLVVSAGLVVNLLQDVMLPVPFHEVGIAALALAEQLQNSVFHAIDGYDIHQKPPTCPSVSEATLLPSFMAAMMSPSLR